MKYSDEHYPDMPCLTNETPRIVFQPEDLFQSILILPPKGKGQRSGGLRTKGYFKRSCDSRPLVTVVTVVFNGASELGKTLKSVLTQRYDNIEYIIIDGGSEDGTVDIIKKYEGRLDYWVSEPDKGIYDAMNKGVRLAQGEWINFMNAGDTFVTEHVLERIFCENRFYERTDFIYSDVLFDEKRVGQCQIEENAVNHQSLIYRKRMHHIAGLYLVGKEILISDYLFFMTCKEYRWHKTDVIIASYDTRGMSGKENYVRHFRQKMGIDLLFGNIGRLKASISLIIYPTYHKIRKKAAEVWADLLGNDYGR